MQWFLLIAFTLSLFACIAVSAIVLILTKNIVALGIPLIPTPLLLAMRPIVRYIFPQEQGIKKRVP